MMVSMVAASMEPVLLGGIYSTNGSAIIATMVVTWVVFWGALSAVVFGIWHRPNYWWLAIGVTGPLGPIIAILAGAATARREGSGNV